LRSRGLGGCEGIGRTLLLSLDLLYSPSRRVETDEEDDSRTDGSPCESKLEVVSSVIFRAVGGRLRVGLSCRTLEVIFAAVETMIPGEVDDMEVGVELMLKGPGE
jgi:hypothetical protein